ncbi:MAG TPA: hypothetical protein VMG12_18430, partial [Polyangiaceae bacterium]|nr:hypothetical protein [Polyangiaceae bacterium]
VDREDCDTAQLCQATLGSCSGENCRCEASVCDPGERRCNGAQPQICNAGQTGFESSGQSCDLDENCNRSTGRCFACAVGDVSCNNGQLLGCALDRSGFTIPLGTQRCVSDTGGERSQSCNGSTLVDTRCPAGSPECVAGSGCKECDPGDFDPECATTSSRTVCLEGDIQTAACTGAASCVDAVCGGGACNTSSRARGAACTRPGGAPGFCDGLQRDPSCVECVNNSQCNDNNECTDNVCSADGRCTFPALTGSCNNGAGSCNGQGQCVQCLRSADCDDDNECTTNTCSNAGRCEFPATMGGRCEGDGFCRAGACVECLGPGDCNDGKECTTDSCSDAGRCLFAPRSGTCNGGADVCSVDICVDCLDGVGGCAANQICQGTTCVAACNPAACPFQRCNAQGTACDTCQPSDCVSNPTSCETSTCVPGSLSCTPGNRNGAICGPTNTGTCVGATCDDPGPVDPNPSGPGGAGGEGGSGNGGEPPGIPPEGEAGTAG